MSQTYIHLWDELGKYSHKKQDRISPHEELGNGMSSLAATHHEAIGVYWE